MKHEKSPARLVTFELTNNPAPWGRRNVTLPGPQSKYALQLNETQVAELTPVSLCYTAPFAQGQRARILLWAHQHPDWTNGRIAPAVGCYLHAVKT